MNFRIFQKPNLKNFWFELRLNRLSLHLRNEPMSDALYHECGIAFIRLLKPLSYYQKKYGTPLYGLNKLYLLMEKQHNRGQDGAGVASIKLDVQPGELYINRYRSVAKTAITDIFSVINEPLEALKKINPDINRKKLAHELAIFSMNLPENGLTKSYSNGYIYKEILK